MKKNFIAVFPVIVFAVLSVFGQQTQTKLYFSSTQEAGVTVDLANLSIWKVASPDGSSFGGSVSETRDNINFLHISQAKPDGNDKSVAFSISDFLAVAGIDMNFSLGNDNWNYNILYVNGGKTLKTKGDFNIAMSLPIWSSIADLSVGSGSAIGIGGNFTLRQSGGGVSILSVGGNESASLFKVAENMVLS